MELLQTIFKDSKAVKTNTSCPKCTLKLYQKKIQIDTLKFKIIKQIGITHKAVNFCIGNDCPYLEQGIIFYNGKHENFLGLEEIDIIMSKRKK
jgi:hypothetical protein